MISLAQVLSSKPILLTQNLYFNQPTLQEIIDMGENTYWAAVNIWTLKRKDIIAEENEFTQQLSDYEVWKQYMLSAPILRRSLAISCQILLKTKIEFFDVSNTIYIGERESGLILDDKLYLVMNELCNKILPDVGASEEGQQYRETENMSERERQLIEKMKMGQKKIEQINNPSSKPEDYLGNKILGLVAIGHYTFEQVYNMTMLQFNKLLKKYVDVQSFEIRSMLSPYISSEDGQNENKFWLD